MTPSLTVIMMGVKPVWTVGAVAHNKLSTRQLCSTKLRCERAAGAPRAAERRPVCLTAAPAHRRSGLHWCLVLEEKTNARLVNSAASQVERLKPLERRDSRVSAAGEQQPRNPFVAESHGAHERCAAVLKSCCLDGRPVLQEKAGALQGALCSALGRSVEGCVPRPSLRMLGVRQRRLKPEQLGKGKVIASFGRGVSDAAHADLVRTWSVDQCPLRRKKRR